MTDPRNLGQGHVAPYEDASQLLQALGGSPVTLWYLGEQAERFLALPGWGSDTVSTGDMGTRLNAYADDVETALMSLDDQVLGVEADRLAWEASLVAERHSTLNELHLDIARFLHLEACLKAGGSHVFLVDDPRFGEALAKAGRANGLSVNWTGKPTSGPSMVAIARSKMSALKTALHRRSALKTARQNAPADWSALKDCDVLVFDWAEAGMFEPGAEISQTRSLYRIPKVLEKGGHKIGFVFSPITWNQPFAAIAETVCAAASPAVFVDECRTLGDVLRGIWASLRLKSHLSGRFTYDGLDLSAFVDLILEADTQTAQPSLAYSYSGVARTLAQKGVRPKAIFHPYENQGWERALDAGFRQWLPQTKIVAFQAVPFPKRYISFFPSPTDIQTGRIADRLICMGPHFADLFTQHGFPASRISIGGALAFEDAFKAANEKTSPEASSAFKTVLCSTPIKYSDALNLCEKVVTAAETVGGIKVVINFHPTVNQAFRDDIKTAMQSHHADMADRIVYSKERGRALLAGSDAMFFNISGIVFDALIFDVPAYYVSIDGKVSLNKVSETLAPELLSVDQICDVLSDLKTPKPIDPTDARDAEFKRCLSRADDQVFLDALAD